MTKLWSSTKLQVGVLPHVTNTFFAQTGNGEQWTTEQSKAEPKFSCAVKKGKLPPRQCPTCRTEGAQIDVRGPTCDDGIVSDGFQCLERLPGMRVYRGNRRALANATPTTDVHRAWLEGTLAYPRKTRPQLGKLPISRRRSVLISQYSFV